MAKKQLEYGLHSSVCQYIRMQYPDILFLSDTVASLMLTFPQQARNKKIQCNDFHCPDLIILEPRGEWHGLLIELKVKSPFKKNGELLKDEHLEGQQKTINDLKSKGYYACFSWSLEMTMEIINNYLKNR